MFVVLLVLVLAPFNVMAAPELRGGSAEQWTTILTVAALVGLWLLYERGAQRTPVKPWRRWLLRGTLMVTLFTVVGPIDRLAEVSAAMHMAQHMLIIVLIAPLVALSKPLPQLMVATGKRGKPLWGSLFKITQYPMFCAYLHGVVIWVWHIPLFYMLAVENSWVHAFAHFCFLLSGVWFWWACLYAASRKVPFALLALLLTLMHTGFLGALLTFANAPLYSEARHLQDQQLAGLLMWVVGGVPYMAASIWAGHRWYRQLNRRMHNA
ncbi:MAG: cytochrome c oxidase assembly protein [Idiomarina sp.]|nr:cytochrome c oxidase assembly protein [Idiomarina sp.]